MPDTCGTGNKTISCLYGVTKIDRIDIGGYPALLKFTFVSIVQVGIGNAAQLILRGGTQAGYNIVYYGTAPRGGGTFDLSTYIMTQDVNYIDVEFAHLTGGDTTAEYTLTYKIECPIAIGKRIDLHWSPDTTGHSCDSMHIPSGGSGDEAWAGYSGFLPYLVEGGSLSIGKKIFGLPTVLTAKTDFGNDVWMTSNDRNLQYGSVPMPYHSALPLVGNDSPNYSFNSSNEITEYQVASGYYSDGAISVYVNNGVITSVAPCMQDYYFESNKFRSGDNAYISCYHIGGLGFVTSDVTVTYRITGVISSTYVDRSLTIYTGTSANFEYFSLVDLGFTPTESVTFILLYFFPPADTKFYYFFPSS